SESRVVLPEPDSPTIATRSPAAMSSEMSSRMVSWLSGRATVLPTPRVRRLPRPGVLASSASTECEGADAMGPVLRGWAVGALVMLAMLAAPDAFARELKVLVMGDSLSAAHGLRPEQGWVALADAKSTKYAFHNASISGETTAGGRSRFAQELARARPDIVVIELGANDGLRGLPLRQMGENLGWMIGAAKAAGARVL